MKRLLRSGEGGTATEFALILPALILVLMVLIEGSRVLNVWMIVSNESREAARYGVAYRQEIAATPACPLSCEVASHATTQLGQMLNPTWLQPLTVCAPDDGCPSSVEVTTSYTVNTITPIIQALKPSITVSAHAQMRLE